MRQRERDAMLAAADAHWWYRGRRRILRAELGLLDVPAGSRLLDAGCGSGQTLTLLEEFGAATGVDPDPGSVALAVGRGQSAAVAALPRLPFEDETFAV